MRNLKKVLSLTLALVMMLGMMTFAGAAETKKVTTAADLTDMDKVVNKEAVSLLVDLKIVAGRDTGAFDPKGTLTRAEFAKMIYVAKMGADDKAANFIGAATGLTDTKMWAEGYINYCYSTGIVSGRGAGKFDPEGKVQTVEAAKMLLVALGFDPEAQGYINDSLWSVNVMQDAKKAGLMAGVKDAANVALSRDSAAQMIYNALFAKTVTNERQKDFTGKWYVSKTTQNATTLGMESFNLVKVTGKVTAANATSVTFTDENVGAKTYPIAVPGSLGKTITLYAKFDYTVSGNTVTYGAFKSLVSMQAAIATSTVLGKSVDGTSFADLTNSDKDAYIAALDDGSNGTATVEYYYNGAKLTTYTTTTLAWAGLGSAAGDAVVAGEPVHVTAADAFTTLLGNGVVVSFIDNDSNGKADVVDIAAPLSAKVTAYSTKNKGSVTFSKTIAGSTTHDGDKVVGFDAIAKDDFVTLTASNGKVTAVKATTVEGKITSKNTAKGTIVIDGKTYELAMNKVTTLTMANLSVGADVILALDPSGYIIATGATAAVTNDKYLYITANDAVTMAGAQAKAVFSDGTASVITVTKVDGTAVTGVSNALVGAYTFTLKDGKYSLSAKLDTDLAKGGTIKYTAKKGIATVASTGADGGTDATVLSGKYASGATLFVDTVNGKVFTGYNALPTTAEFTAGTIIYDANNTSLMRIVYMSAGITSTTGSKDQIVIADVRANESQDADGNALYTYTAIVNGVAKDVVLDTTAKAVVDHKTNGGAGIYTVNTTDTAGVITSLVRVGAADFGAKKAVTVVTADTLVYDDGKVIALTADTIYVEVDTAKHTTAVVGNGNLATAAPFDNIIVIPVSGTIADGTAEGNTAKIVYIIK